MSAVKRRVVGSVYDWIGNIVIAEAELTTGYKAIFGILAIVDGKPCLIGQCETGLNDRTTSKLAAK